MDKEEYMKKAYG